ncbi:MAG TPA: CinA family protein [bacterium]|nr:CinA family protein [bacterium]
MCDDTIRQLAQDALTVFGKRGETLAVAESCTGGMLGAALTAVAGSSAYFLGGVIAYDNRLKVGLLGVEQKALDDYGAVSVAVARQMAEGAAQRTGAGVAVGITGVAGPTGSEGKPVGTVYIAIARGESSRVQKYQFAGDRDAVRTQTVQRALELLLGREPNHIPPDTQG